MPHTWPLRMRLKGEVEPWCSQAITVSGARAGETLQSWLQAVPFQQVTERKESPVLGASPHASPPLQIALLKILLAAAPTSKAKTDSINILADVLPEEMP